MTIAGISSKRKTIAYRIFSGFVAFTFIFSLILPPGYAQMVPQTILNLPVPGTMVSVSAGFAPLLVKGITIHPDNPLRFDFIVDPGQSGLEGEQLRSESTRLIKYFLASLTVPEDELWVNLSPYEKDRMISGTLGETEMGRDMLAQDYILKQLTASLMYPEKELGKKFWDKIYQQAREKYGTTEIPVNTFNKVWIVPQKAVVYQHGNSALVVESRLRVMLEQDYLAASQGHQVTKSPDGDLVTGDGVTTNIIREIIIPAIEKEVNTGETFTMLRQIYNSMILAAWYKQNLKESLLGQVYVNQAKTKGVDVADKEVNQKIYAQYLEAFKRGVYNYIKEDYDPASQNVIPRKYFSGGVSASPVFKMDKGVLRVQQVTAFTFLARAKGNLFNETVDFLEHSGRNEKAIAEAQEKALAKRAAANLEEADQIINETFARGTQEPVALAASPVTRKELLESIKAVEKLSIYESKTEGAEEWFRESFRQILDDARTIGHGGLPFTLSRTVARMRENAGPVFAALLRDGKVGGLSVDDKKRITKALEAFITTSQKYPGIREGGTIFVSSPVLVDGKSPAESFRLAGLNDDFVKIASGMVGLSPDLRGILEDNTIRNRAQAIVSQLVRNLQGNADIREIKVLGESLPGTEKASGDYKVAIMQDDFAVEKKSKIGVGTFLGIYKGEGLIGALFFLNGPITTLAVTDGKQFAHYAYDGEQFRTRPKTRPGTLDLSLATENESPVSVGGVYSEWSNLFQKYYQENGHEIPGSQDAALKTRYSGVLGEDGLVHGATATNLYEILINNGLFSEIVSLEEAKILSLFPQALGGKALVMTIDGPKAPGDIRDIQKVRGVAGDNSAVQLFLGNRGAVGKLWDFFETNKALYVPKHFFPRIAPTLKQGSDAVTHSSEKMEDFLNERVPADMGNRADVIDAIKIAAEVAKKVGPLYVEGARPTGEIDSGGAKELAIDKKTDQLLIDAFAGKVGAYYSEDRGLVRDFRGKPGSQLQVTADALDGSSRVEANGGAGSILSFRRALLATSIEKQSGREIIASMLVAHGITPKIIIAIEGMGAHEFVFDEGTFYHSRAIDLGGPKDETKGLRIALGGTRAEWPKGFPELVDKWVEVVDAMPGYSGAFVTDIFGIIDHIMDGGLGFFAQARDKLRVKSEIQPVAHLIRVAGGADLTWLHKKKGKAEGLKTSLDAGLTPEPEPGKQQKGPSAFGDKTTIAVMDAVLAAASPVVASEKHLNPAGREVIKIINSIVQSEQPGIDNLKILNQLGEKIALLQPRRKASAIFSGFDEIEKGVVIAVQTRTSQGKLAFPDAMEYVAYAALNPEETKIADALLRPEDKENYFTKALEAVQKSRQVKSSSPVGLPEGRWEHWAQTAVTMDDLNVDIFRDYDYRNVGPVLKPEIVFRLGLVWAGMAIKKAERAGITSRTVLIAKDARKIEPELEDALVAALRYRGLNVVYVAKDTPNAVTSYSWAVQQFKPLMSIFNTASHLSKKEGVIVRGFKVAMLNKLGGNIQSMTTEEIKGESLQVMKDIIAHPGKIAEMEAPQKGTFMAENIDANVIRFNTLIGKVAAAKGSLYELGKAIKESENPVAVLEQFEARYRDVPLPLKGMRVVVDGSHTPSGMLTARTFANLGAEVVSINEDIQEISGEHKADPSVKANLKELEDIIVEVGSDFGMAFDLDGDRGLVDVPQRFYTTPEVRFQDLAPDNMIVILSPSLKNDWGYNLEGRRYGVIRDVLGTHGVNDRVKELGMEFYQTDAGYVFLKAKKEEKEKEGVIFPMYGERSGHIWLHVTGEIENPLAVNVLFAVLARKEKKEFFDRRVRGMNMEGQTIRPIVEVVRAREIPYGQSPRFQPLFHPELLKILSQDARNTTGWRYDPQAKEQKNPPQAIIALGKDLAIKMLKEEFTPGKSYITPTGTLVVKEVKDYLDEREHLYRFIDIAFEKDGRFIGRFVFRASSNDPSFVASYETPIILKDVELNQIQRSSITGVVIDFLVSKQLAVITQNDMKNLFPRLTEAEVENVHEKANLSFAEGDYERYKAAASPIQDRGGEEDAVPFNEIQLTSSLPIPEDEGLILWAEGLAPSREKLLEPIKDMAVFDSEDEEWKFLPGGRAIFDEWGKRWLQDHIGNITVEEDVQQEATFILNDLQSAVSSPMAETVTSHQSPEWVLRATGLSKVVST
ncbi:MAG: hypothetical protein HZA28_08060 [Candidatus Omnitrophica bacterium]|nr:hypothetical protein [Candidatus Omnitrophota bacterium]